LADWLTPLLAGRTSLRGMSQDLDRALNAMLDWEQRTMLDRHAPVHYVAPTGTRVAIDYSDPAAPSVGIRLQEMFGVKETPTVDGGRIALTLELLSPARRAVQVTRDLAGFWKGSYFEVRRELRGRYPKHVWPDDPLLATPTTRAKRRGE
jgi:ATP-dependent RNA helicase HrpB